MVFKLVIAVWMDFRKLLEMQKFREVLSTLTVLETLSCGFLQLFVTLS
jgi:hypothetical protein